jgi:membrane-bound ClpP family serine protease
VAHFESGHGRLITKQFWSRSLVGQEGMVLKQGVVVEECAPTGKVQIGSEIWNAESIDRKPIEVGQVVIVRDVEGLKLIVERSS